MKRASAQLQLDGCKIGDLNLEKEKLWKLEWVVGKDLSDICLIYRCNIIIHKEEIAGEIEA